MSGKGFSKEKEEEKFFEKKTFLFSLLPLDACRLFPSTYPLASQSGTAQPPSPQRQPRPPRSRKGGGAEAPGAKRAPGCKSAPQNLRAPRLQSPSRFPVAVRGEPGAYALGRPGRGGRCGRGARLRRSSRTWRGAEKEGRGDNDGDDRGGGGGGVEKPPPPLLLFEAAAGGGGGGGVGQGEGAPPSPCAGVAQATERGERGGDRDPRGARLCRRGCSSSPLPLPLPLPLPSLSLLLLLPPPPPPPPPWKLPHRGGDDHSRLPQDPLGPADHATAVPEERRGQVGGGGGDPRGGRERQRGQRQGPECCCRCCRGFGLLLRVSSRPRGQESVENDRGEGFRERGGGRETSLREREREREKRKKFCEGGEEEEDDDEGERKKERKKQKSSPSLSLSFSFTSGCAAPAAAARPRPRPGRRDAHSPEHPVRRRGIGHQEGTRDPSTRGSCPPRGLPP